MWWSPLEHRARGDSLWGPSTLSLVFMHLAPWVRTLLSLNPRPGEVDCHRQVTLFVSKSPYSMPSCHTLPVTLVQRVKDGLQGSTPCLLSHPSWHQPMTLLEDGGTD